MRFDGSLFLERESALSGLTTATKGLFIGWLKAESRNRYHFAAGNGADYFVKLGFEGDAESQAAEAILLSADYTGELDIGASDSDDLAEWQCTMWAWDTQAGVFQCYVGDTDRSEVITSDGIPFTQTWSLLTQVYLFGFGDYNYVGAASTTRLFVGQTLDLSVEANRRLIIDEDGNQVNHSVLTAALGTPGVILLDGNTEGFLINQGTGGEIELPPTWSRTVSVNNPGPSFLSISNIFAGIAVASVHNDTDDQDISAEFESVTSVRDQVQQTGTTDFTEKTVTVTFTSGELQEAVATISMHWRGEFSGGFVDATTPTDTVLADIVGSGAYPGAPAFVSFSEISDPDSKFTVTGSTLVLSASLVADENHSVTVRGTDTEAATADGTFTVFAV